MMRSSSLPGAALAADPAAPRGFPVRMRARSAEVEPRDGGGLATQPRKGA